MQIITDSATLLSPAEAQELGVTILPACVLLDGKVYKDYEDIGSEDFLKLVNAGAIATSSQPAIGDIIDIFENQEEKEDILFISIGDGLSGGYQSAVGAKNSMDDSGHIHIVDTKSLAGPERYLVKKAIKLKEEGLDIKAIVKELQKSIETSVSFVIPEDFEFLKRSGRLTPIAAKIGGIIKIVPVLTQTEDMKRIKPFAIKRSKKKAVEAIIEHLKSMGVDANYLITIGHAGACETAKTIMNQIKAQFSETMMELLPLSPTLITHGGPGCVTIQAIRK